MIEGGLGSVIGCLIVFVVVTKGWMYVANRIGQQLGIASFFKVCREKKIKRVDNTKKIE